MVRAPVPFEPGDVAQVQAAVGGALRKPLELVIRSVPISRLIPMR
ncbi:MAG: hypothetical protein AB7F50_01910 [Fimbriimonadaceae bacterium]